MGIEPVTEAWQALSLHGSQSRIWVFMKWLPFGGVRSGVAVCMETFWRKIPAH